MVRVDVGSLDADETANVFTCRTQPLPQQFRNRLDELGVHVRESRELLLQKRNGVS